MVVLLLAGCTIAFGQESPQPKPPPSYSLSILSGIGNQNFLPISVPYTYDNTFLQVEVARQIHARKRWEIELFLQPQYNWMDYRQVNTDVETKKGWEIGVSPGITARLKLHRDWLLAYVSGAVGPHYVSGAPERQAPGFIFSDQIVGGFHIRVASRLQLDLRSGWRHLSNANLVPDQNGGLNSILFLGGLRVDL